MDVGVALNRFLRPISIPSSLILSSLLVFPPLPPHRRLSSAQRKELRPTHNNSWVSSRTATWSHQPSHCYCALSVVSDQVILTKDFFERGYGCLRVAGFARVALVARCGAEVMVNNEE